MKTPEEMATDYANNNSGNCCANDFPGLREAWLAGYKAAMEQVEYYKAQADKWRNELSNLNYRYAAKCEAYAEKCAEDEGRDAMDQVADKPISLSVREVEEHIHEAASRAFHQGYDSAKGHYQTEWISVKDRLPEINQGFIAFVNNKEVCNCDRYQNRSTDDTPIFYASTKTGLLICSLESVSHWQPLPAPPKEEK
jgi:hypothetical protein